MQWSVSSDKRPRTPAGDVNMLETWHKSELLHSSLRTCYFASQWLLMEGNKVFWKVCIPGSRSNHTQSLVITVTHTHTHSQSACSFPKLFIICHWACAGVHIMFLFAVRLLADTQLNRWPPGRPCGCLCHCLALSIFPRLVINDLLGMLVTNKNRNCKPFLSPWRLICSFILFTKSRKRVVLWI